MSTHKSRTMFSLVEDAQAELKENGVSVVVPPGKGPVAAWLLFLAKRSPELAALIPAKTIVRDTWLKMLIVDILLDCNVSVSDIVNTSALRCMSKYGL